MRKIALYGRCSTAKQHPDAQLHELRDYARRRGAEAIEYVDRAESGAKDRRPALDRLVAAAQASSVHPAPALIIATGVLDRGP